MKRIVTIQLKDGIDHNQPVMRAEAIAGLTTCVRVLKGEHNVWGGAELLRHMFTLVDDGKRKA